MIKVYEALLAAYGPREWWPAKTPYEMMIGAILTQNTSWTNVEKAISAFGDRLCPEFVTKVELEDLAAIIRPSGYHNQKSLRLKELTKWYATYFYDIQLVKARTGESLRQELLAIKGIGPETADSILLYALDKEYFVIDAYTRRIFCRLGWQVPIGYDDFQGLITREIPRDLQLFNEFHALLVEHAKLHCRKKPICAGCPLAFRCPEHCPQ